MQCALAYFLLMFMFWGMPFINLAYLRKQDVKENRIVYSRHKTRRQMTMRIPKEAIPLIEEFKNTNPGSVYLFPILDAQGGKKEKTEPQWEEDEKRQKTVCGLSAGASQLQQKAGASGGAVAVGCETQFIYAALYLGYAGFLLRCEYRHHLQGAGTLFHQGG